MTDATADEALETYLQALRVRLGLTGAELSEVLDECRDHLCSHVELLRAQGRSPAAAARLAVREFGDPGAVASGMRAEFRRRVLRRLSGLLLVAGPVLGLAWQLVVALGPPAPWPDRSQPPVLAVFDFGSELTATAALVLAAASLAMISLSGRFGASPGRPGWQRWSFGSCAAAVGCALAALVQTVGYLVARGLIDGHSLAWPPVAGVAALTAVGAAPFVSPLRAVLALRRAVAA